MRPRTTTTCCTALAWLFLLRPGAAEDWPRFRGPNGAAVSSVSPLPTTWSDRENVVWKTDLPGPGSSSPITYGESVYVTCYSGYGTSRESPGEKSDLRRHLVCVRLDDGRIRWQADLPVSGHEHEYRGYLHLHGYASHTPVADGDGVYAFCGAGGIAAHSHDGRRTWSVDCGHGSHEWGSGGALLSFDDLVIVAAGIESGALIAFDKRSGRERWRTVIGCGHGSPALARVGESHELVFVRNRHVIGVDPRTGTELWHCAVPTQLAIPMPVVHEGVVYVSTRDRSAAVRAGGRGDVSHSHLLWEANHGSHVATPVSYRGHLYFPHDEHGTVYCLKADTGELAYKERLPRSPKYLYASPVVADGKLYLTSQNDGTFVLAAVPEYELLAHNVFASDGTRFNATPAIAGGRLLIRSGKSLYCLEMKEDSAR